jgi:NADH dehydrogenase FAD-containing subunit
MNDHTPFSAEACDCGGPYPLRAQFATAQGKTCYAVSNDRVNHTPYMNAVSSVASLEWNRRIDEQPF